MSDLLSFMALVVSVLGGMLYFRTEVQKKILLLKIKRNMGLIPFFIVMTVLTNIVVSTLIQPDEEIDIYDKLPYTFMVTNLLNFITIVCVLVLFYCLFLKVKKDMRKLGIYENEQHFFNELIIVLARNKQYSEIVQLIRLEVELPMNVYNDHEFNDFICFNYPVEFLEMYKVVGYFHPWLKFIDFHQKANCFWNYHLSLTSPLLRKDSELRRKINEINRNKEFSLFGGFFSESYLDALKSKIYRQEDDSAIEDYFELFFEISIEQEEIFDVDFIKFCGEISNDCSHSKYIVRSVLNQLMLFKNQSKYKCLQDEYTKIIEVIFNSSTDESIKRSHLWSIVSARVDISDLEIKRLLNLIVKTPDHYEEVWKAANRLFGSDTYWLSIDLYDDSNVG